MVTVCVPPVMVAALDATLPKVQEAVNALDPTAIKPSAIASHPIGTSAPRGTLAHTPLTASENLLLVRVVWSPKDKQ